MTTRGCASICAQFFVGAVFLSWSPTTAAEPLQPEAYKPVWKIGQQWVVETVSRQTAARRSLPLAAKPDPIRWQFRVQAMSPLEGRDCFLVRVECLSGETRPVTKLWVDSQSMTLRQVETELPVPGGFRTLVETYGGPGDQPFPAFSPLTVPPLELPLFRTGTKGLETYTYRASSGPPGEKALGEIDFEFAVKQRFTPVQADAVQGLLPADYTKGIARQQTVEVQLETARASVRQLWQPGLPWPVYSDNGVSDARLVQVVTAPKEKETPAEKEGQHRGEPSQEKRNQEEP